MISLERRPNCEALVIFSSFSSATMSFIFSAACSSNHAHFSSIIISSSGSSSTTTVFLPSLEVTGTFSKLMRSVSRAISCSISLELVYLRFPTVDYLCGFDL